MEEEYDVITPVMSSADISAKIEDHMKYFLINNKSQLSKFLDYSCPIKIHKLDINSSEIRPFMFMHALFLINKGKVYCTSILDIKSIDRRAHYIFHNYGGMTKSLYKIFNDFFEHSRSQMYSVEVFDCTRVKYFDIDNDPKIQEEISNDNYSLDDPSDILKFMKKIIKSNYNLSVQVVSINYEDNNVSKTFDITMPCNIEDETE